MTLIYIPYQGELHQIQLSFELGELASIKHFTIKTTLVSYLANVRISDEEGMMRPQSSFGLPFVDFLEKVTATAALFCGGSDKVEEEILAAKKKAYSAVERHRILCQLGYFGGIEAYFSPVPPRK